MKKRIRLSKPETELLEIEYKGHDADGSHKKYLLDEEQQKTLNDSRSVKVGNFTETSPNNYKKKPKIVLSAWDEKTETMMSMDEYCKRYKLPSKDITSYKLITHTGTPFYNIVFKTIIEKIKEDLTEEFIENTIIKFIEPAQIKPSTDLTVSHKENFDRVVYTDCHIGMDTNKDGNALYPEKWDEKVLMGRMREMVEHIIKHKSSDVLIIDELGDLLDGWNAETVRKGHHLPQNMDNKKAFDVALTFKVQMIQLLVPYFEMITCNNICEDNHAGAFGYLVNSAFKRIIEMQFSGRVFVENHESFINHYSLFDRTFVITHGKDSKNLKFGFKPHLDTKQIEKIDQYMKHNKLYNGNDIEFCKGDSHQALFDMCSSDDFDYFNYPAFAPSSEWVQTNFKKGRSGFVLQHYSGDNRIINPYFFK